MGLYIEDWLALSFASLTPREKWHQAAKWLVSDQAMGVTYGAYRRAIFLARTWAEDPNHHLIPIDHPNYPPLLRTIEDPPILLYVKGRPSVLAKDAISIVGSRHPSAYGLKQARHFAYHLAKANKVVVSGLAIGVDGAAHRAALEASGFTVAWMPCGLHRCYPKRHQGLAARISLSGALVSEWPLEFGIRRENFRQRNRLITAMSQTLLVIEARARSGTMVSAHYALEQNREVCVVPAPLQEISMGNHILLQDGAKEVLDHEGVLEVSRG